MILAFTLGASLLASPAYAGKCDYLLRQADSAKGEALEQVFRELASCDRKLAEENYIRFMSSATDSDLLVSLSMTAIHADVWNPVWQQLGKISSYDARDEIARRIGETCSQDEKVVSFLQGAYFGLRDIDFQQWDDAFIACESPTLMDWMTQQVESPPDKVFDEKYNALMDIYMRRLKGRALHSLATAAIKAAEAGPYDAILMQINAAVAPELGDVMPPEDQKTLQEELVRVARGVSNDKAHGVADSLANAGFQEAAARLLPTVYKERQQSDGSFLYGAVAIEAGECKGTNTAIVHVVEVKEPGKRWIVLTDVQKAIREVKPKLGKCNTDGEVWPVAVTPEPVGTGKDIDPWVAALVKQWTDKGFEVKTQNDRTIVLP